LLRRLDLSATGWTRVVLATFGGTAFCIAAALFVDSFNFATMNESEIRRAVATDILLPTGLAAPLLFLLTYKMRQLAIAYAELMVVATTDSLTNLLNRRAFTVLVEAFLERVDVAPSVGALLIVDADNFKRINDEFGHERGDVALRIIAQAISETLRDADIVGRIGGEEFAVLLPGATAGQAAAAAERIRRAVSDAVFTTNGKARPLTASVGGVAFDRTATYDQLFVAADRRLYEAKAGGRDRVSIEFLAQPVVA
jgi:diguanylate cyclase (GGDEF)-like protein